MINYPIMHSIIQEIKMTEEDKGFKLTERELDNLQWARDFMKLFETKESKASEINRNRQQKYF